MVDFIREYNVPVSDMDLIVPVPLYKTRLREREFNQAGILCGYIAKEFNKEASDEALIRLRDTKTQTELDLDARLLNVKNSFSVTKKTNVQGKKILLVDDVLTSGATCSEAAASLKDAGAAIVFVLTLAN